MATRRRPRREKLVPRLLGPGGPGRIDYGGRGPENSGGFVASSAAPIATGWCDENCRVRLARGSYGGNRKDRLRIHSVTTSWPPTRRTVRSQAGSRRPSQNRPVTLLQSPKMLFFSRPMFASASVGDPSCGGGRVWATQTMFARDQPRATPKDRPGSRAPVSRNS